MTTKASKSAEFKDTMRPKCDMSGGVRGKYARLKEWSLDVKGPTKPKETLEWGDHHALPDGFTAEK